MTTVEPKTRRSRSERQTSRILALLAQETLTAQQIADRIHLSRDMVNFYLARMKVEQRIYIARYIFNVEGRPAPAYRFGCAPDAVYVKTRTPRPKVTAEDRRRQILKALRNKMLCVDDIAEKLQLSSARIRDYVLELRRAKEIHIGAWGKRHVGGTLPLYALGNEPDAVRDPPDQLKRHKEYRERHHERLKERRRMRERLKSKPQSWAAALGL